MAMREIATQIKTVIGRLIERLPLRAGLLTWTASYAPMIAALVVGLPIAAMPMIFDTTAWAFVFTLPLGVTAGLLAFLGVYMMMEE
jgi:hypothetical protein